MGQVAGQSQRAAAGLGEAAVTAQNIAGEDGAGVVAADGKRGAAQIEEAGRCPRQGANGLVVSIEEQHCQGIERHGAAVAEGIGATRFQGASHDMGGTAVGVGTGTAEGKIASASLGESAGTGDHAVILVTKRHIEYHGAVVDQGGTGSHR